MQHIRSAPISRLFRFSSPATRDKRNNAVIREMFECIFDELNDANAFVHAELLLNNESNHDDILPNSSFQSTEFVPQVFYIRTVNDVPCPELFKHDSPFMSSKMFKYLREKANVCLTFSCRIKERDIHVHFITYGTENGDIREVIVKHQVYVYRVYMWLSIILKASTSVCSRTLHIYFYMTPLKKELPGEMTATLGSDNVNTGVSRGCISNGEIVVYREEEWFKVFVHETMHNFGMDFLDRDLTQANQVLHTMYPGITHEVLLFEAYTELWARIINISFVAYFMPATKTFTGFLHFVRDGMEIETYFSAYQCAKVLDYMELDYATLISKERENVVKTHERYAENTNVFAYYVLCGGVLFQNYDIFFKWCGGVPAHGNCKIPIRFSQTIPSFMKLLKDVYQNEWTIQSTKVGENALSHGESHHEVSKTLRMTIVEHL